MNQTGFSDAWPTRHFQQQQQQANCRQSCKPKLCAPSRKIHGIFPQTLTNNDDASQSCACQQHPTMHAAAGLSLMMMIMMLHLCILVLPAV